MTKRDLPRHLYRAEQVRALDACAIREFGIPGMTLMERAGQAAFAIIQRRWPQAARIVVFCGSGNNGGDGYVIASLARRAGKDVTVIHIGARERLTGDAHTAMQQAVAARVTMLDALDPAVSLPVTADLVVDALLGTGLQGAVRPEYIPAIEAINACGAPVLAVDVPSGLCSDTGAQRGTAVRADATVMFIGLKQGAFTGRGPALCGEVHFDDLMIPRDVFSRVVPTFSRRVERIDESLVAELLSPRERDAHKGRFGHVLVIGGELGFAGAVMMAAEAAARSGAGLVSVATRTANVGAINARCPEVMAHGIEREEQLAALLAKATVVVAGPGLGQSSWAWALLARALAADVPLVLDADALNLLPSGKPVRSSGYVLTPHPGEAARLLGVDVASVQADRFRSARSLQHRYGGVVLLKGAGTVIDAGAERAVAIADAGNPGMATGGMGDVLTGIIAGLMAQHLSPADAARLGAVLHGAAADRCAQAHGERGMLATDLFPFLRELVNGRAATGRV